MSRYQAKKTRETISRRNLRLVTSRTRPEYWRPSTRADCVHVPRPCPFVTCRHNLYLDMKANGNVRVNFPDIKPHQMGESCALDIADRGAVAGGATLQEIGDVLGVTREMVRQMEDRLLIHLDKLMREHGATSFEELRLKVHRRTPLGRPNKPKAWADE